MKIYRDIAQGSQEWLDLRARNFTASELGPWAVEPLQIKITVEQAKSAADELGLNTKGTRSKDGLIAMLADAGFSLPLELCDGARTAIISKIKQERRLAMKKRPFESLTLEEIIWLDRENELQAQRDKSFEYNVAVKYGKELEPFAREFYEKKTGYKVEEVGFVEHDSGGFGCSPDGLVKVYRNGEKNSFYWSRGLEIKCPLPETHLAWLLDGGLPECHKLQVHASMVATGLTEWHFLSFCPGDAPLMVTVKRDEFTERLESGLKTLVSEKAKMKARLAEIWKENAKNPSTGEKGKEND